MFLHLSVSHSVHRGVCISACIGVSATGSGGMYTPIGRHLLGRHLPDTPPWTDTPLGRHPPWADIPPRQTPPGQTSTWTDTPWADIPLGRHPLHDTSPSWQTPPRQTPPDTHKLGSPQPDTSHPTGMHYHPHRSCGKVMLIHLSVNHSGGCLPRGGVYPGGVFPVVCLPGGVCHTAWADIPPWQTHTPLGRHTPMPSACWDTHLCPVHAGIHSPTPLRSACWDTVNKAAVPISLECILVKKSLQYINPQSNSSLERKKFC